ncbi:MAG: peptidylprolyl isomerase [Vicingaceae bacterium]
MIRSFKYHCLGLLLLATSTIFSQEKSDPVLLTVAGVDVRVSEFEAVYRKNNQETNKQSLEEYLELYIKFRLKVKDAQDRGLDTLASFKTELGGYRNQLAEPYLSDNTVTEELVKEAYERLKYEVKASHIMVSVSPGSSPSDTLKAYKRLLAIKKRVDKGEDFGRLAKDLSDDPSARENSGNLGYFSALYMVYPFENAAYNLEIGQVSNPVRTQFGYHLVKLEDKRENRGEITVAHIMTRVPKDANEAEIESSRMKIDEIYDKLKAGENFELMAGQFSDDQASAKRGGRLPAFSAGKMVLEFEDAAFSLENDGDFSKPVMTEYGFHIIKRLKLKKVGSFDQVAGELKQRIARDGRSRLSKTAFIKRVKEEYGFKENLQRRKDFYSVLDTTLFEQKWTVDKAGKLNKTMFSLGDTTITQQDFATYIANHQPNGRQMGYTAYVNFVYDQYVEEVCTKYEDVRLMSKYPEFRLLMHEYHDGILLFDLTDDLVWSKAVKDSAGLAKFYQEHKTEHMWPERLQASVFSCVDEARAKSVRKMVKARKKKSYTNSDILKANNESSQLNLEIESDKFVKGDNNMVDAVEWEEGISDIIEKDGRFYLVEVLKVLPPQPKELNEIRGIMTSAYQSQLEESWVKDLRERYPVKVYKENLSLIK